MAHMEKYSRQDLKRVARETYRELDQDKYQNYVDPTRTDQNYSMRGFKTSAQFMRALDDRTDEIVETRMDGKPTQKPPKYASWVNCFSSSHANVTARKISLIWLFTWMNQHRTRPAMSFQNVFPANLGNGRYQRRQSSNVRNFKRFILILTKSVRKNLVLLD